MSDMTSSQASQSNVNFNTGEAYVVPIESEQTDVTQPSVYSQKQVQDSMSTSTDKSTTQTTTYSTDPSSPSVPPSDATTASTTTSSSNAWFSPSFLAAFNSIMMFVLTMETKNNFMEAETERTYQKVATDMGKSVSQLVKAAALNQAEQKMTEAISSFVQAGISGAQALTVMGNTAKAEKEADLQIKTQENKIQQLETTKKPMVDDGTQSPQNLDRKTEIQKHNESVDKSIAKEQRALDSMVANRTAKVMELTHGYNILTNSKFDALKSLTEGTEKSLNSFAMTKYGEIEGLREMTETYRRAAQTVAETAGKGRDSNKSNFNSMLQQWNDIIHKTMQAHSLRS